MSSETHNSVSDFLASESTKSNANVGSSAFSNEKRQMDSASSESSISAISLGVSASSGFSSSASMQTQKTTGIFYKKNNLYHSGQNHNLSRKHVIDQKLNSGQNQYSGIIRILVLITILF